MIYLLLTILANVAIFMAFRAFTHFRVNTFPAIITNYIVCVITGILYNSSQMVVSKFDPGANWFIFAGVLSIIFVSTFFLMARTTQLRGVAVATVASKMSLAIPVVFSLFIFKIATGNLDTWNYLGIGLAFIAILMVSKPNDTTSTKVPLSLKTLGLPLAVFFMGGVIDTSLNYANHHWITTELEPVFPILTFAFAFIWGIIVCIIKKISFTKKDILAGILLGIPNYFSIFLQLKALSAFDNNGAIVYPSLNIGIIIASTLAAVLFFKEKLGRINQAGVVLAIIVIFLLSHQEILKNI
ncbi:MAG: DMT family transporter [Roseivirga sp.]